VLHIPAGSCLPHVVAVTRVAK